MTYRRSAVRDLAWLVFDGALQLPHGSDAPAVVRLNPAERAEFVELLERWDQDPVDGWLGVVDPGLRLGLYTERLVGAWLRQSRCIRLIAMNWPLRAHGITLGEADFLVQRQGSRGSELQLWELACKFYLSVPGRGWIGPELNDSLAAKLARMRGHQLPLIHQPEFQSAWGCNWSARAWLTGWLLDAAATLVDPSPPAAILEEPPHAFRVPAVWAEIGDGSIVAAQSQARALGIRHWWLLPKRRWLRPVFADEPVAQQFAELADAAEFAAVPSGSRRPGDDTSRPLMLAGIRWIKNASHPAVAIEAMRVMLVPRGWARRATSMPVRNQEGCSAGTPEVKG